MRCDQVRQNLEDGGEAYPVLVLDHLRQCPPCASYERDWRWVRSGMVALAQEAGPEPSWGFASRVLRRLDEVLPPLRLMDDFFETAGRRVVYFTFLLAMLLLLAIALPSTGPLRGHRGRDVSWPRPEIVATRDYPIPPGELPGVGLSLISDSEVSGGQK
ncbi:MAG TPA: hypothetical protein VMX16_07785 [Terriglobia bacterium]|nr:hypothetical protein [Terriglobia bacterium]